MLPRWYLVVFIICLIAILIVSSYNIYENFRIKKKCPRSCQESQDILIGLNIIIIVLTFILLLGYWFIGDDPKPAPALASKPPMIMQQQAQGPQGMMNGQGFQYFFVPNLSMGSNVPNSIETCNPFPTNGDWKNIDVAQKL
jgi:hypothetical protein